MSAKSLINWTRTSDGILILNTNLQERTFGCHDPFIGRENVPQKPHSTYIVTSLTMSNKAKPFLVLISDIPIKKYQKQNKLT